MDLAKIIVRSTIVRRNAAISIPQACIGEVTRSLSQCGAAGPLIDLDAQADGRNFQGYPGCRWRNKGLRSLQCSLSPAEPI